MKPIKRRWKILAAILLLIVVAVGVVWAIGGRTYYYQASVTIAAPADRVFAYLTEPKLLVQWMNGVTEVRELTGQGHKVGATSIAIVEQNGRRYELHTEVTETVENRRLGVRITTPMFVVVNTYRLESNGDQTTVAQTMTARYQGLARLFAPFAGPAIQQQLDGDFQRLKRVVETGQAADQ